MSHAFPLLEPGLVRRRQIWATAKTQASCEEVAETLGISAWRYYREAAGTAGIVLVCVKPAQIGAVAEALREAMLRPDAVADLNPGGRFSGTPGATAAAA